MSAFNLSMNTTRYYFPDFIEDDNLSILAIDAKEILQQNENIVKIFKLNKDFLYGRSPRQVLFLMKQNNRSIFSSSPSKEICQNDEKYQDSSPVTRNPNILNMPRRHLPIDDDEEESVYHSETLETNTPVRRQPMMGSSQSSPNEEFLTCDEEFTSSIGSTSDFETDNEESHCSAKIAKMNANFTMKEKPLECSANIEGNICERSQESPSTTERAQVTENLTMDEKQLESSEKLVGNTGDSSRECLHSSTPIRHRTEIVSSNDKSVLNHSTDKIVTYGKQIASPTGSTSSRDGGNEESPRSAEIAKMTANLTMNEKPSESSSKLIGNTSENSKESPRSSTPIRHQTLIVSSKDKAVLNTTEKILRSDEKFTSPIGSTNSHDAAKEESPRSAEIAKMTSNLTIDEKELGNPAKVVDAINLENQKSPKTSEIKKVTSNPKVDKVCGSNEYDGLTDNSTVKDSLTPDEGTVTISKQTVIANEVPGNAKKSKLCSVSASGIHDFPNTIKKVKMTDSSLEDTEEISSFIQCDSKNASPNEAIKEIVRGTRKRKSLSPRRVKTTPFNSVPRVVQVAGKEEIDIEVPCNLEDNASPTTSRSLSADYRINLTKDESPVMSESKTNSSPQSVEGYSHPLERPSSTGNDDVFVGKDSSDIPSTAATATGKISGESESSSTDIKIDPNSLKYTLGKFITLLETRDCVVKRSFYSLLSFQNGIQILNAYVYNASCVILKIEDSAKEYLTKELKDIVNDTSAVALKLRKKIESWETDVNLDVHTWERCFDQIKKLKNIYEPLLTNEGEPIIDFENAQEYELEMKAIWKKMDDMIMMGDSRRALFSNIAYDVEKLMKMFVKCLINIGILYPR